VKRRLGGWCEIAVSLRVVSRKSAAMKERISCQFSVEKNSALAAMTREPERGKLKNLHVRSRC
jgi:hypothetical protein